MLISIHIPMFLVAQTVIVALKAEAFARFFGTPLAMADAQHREALHQASEERQRVAAEQTTLLVRMLEQNTQLTETAKALAERIESLTVELHNHILASKQGG